MLYREARIRATNLTFIFWDVLYPLGYLLVFGVGMIAPLGLRRAVDRGRLQRVLPGRRARHGELRHRVEHGVVVLHGPRQRHLLRDAHLPDEPLAVSARQGAVQRRWSRWCRRSSRSRSPRVLLDVPIASAVCRCSSPRRRRRHGRLVLLLRDLRADDPAQRRVQHGDVDLLLRVPVRELDVLSGRAAAGGVPRRRAANPITWQVDVLRYATIGLGDPTAAARSHRVPGVHPCDVRGALLALRRESYPASGGRRRRWR